MNDWIDAEFELQDNQWNTFEFDDCEGDSWEFRVYNDRTAEIWKNNEEYTGGGIDVAYGYGTSPNNSNNHTIYEASIDSSIVPICRETEIKEKDPRFITDVGDGGWEEEPMTLPVELSMFTAKSTADAVILRWRTESEVNNVGFSIYRSESKDGNYTKVAFVNGAGSSAMPNDYQFADKDAQVDKTYYYYLEDIDITGEKNKSEIIKVVVPIKPVVIRPKETMLMQNYPNPFNPETWIPYQLKDTADVTIRIYDVSGQLIRKFELGKMPVGVYVSKEKAVYWDGKNSSGEKASSGLYFYQLQVGDYSATKRMLILK